MNHEVEALRARLVQAERERDTGRRIAVAMARIIRRINAHPGDLEGNLNEICTAAAALTESTWAFAWLREGDVLRSRGTSASPEIYAELPPEARVQRLDSVWPVAVATREGRTLVADDWVQYLRDHGETEYERSEAYLQHFEALGTRAVMAAPLGQHPCMGSITVLRDERRPYDVAHVSLLEDFAAQAVTAIETARTQQALVDSLERDKAIASLLRVVSRSVEDASPVFESILDHCEQLLGTNEIAILLVDGNGMVYAQALRGSNMTAVMNSVLPLPLEQTSTGWTFRERRAFNIPDTATFPNPPQSVRLAAERFGHLSIVFAPMFLDEQGIGSISIMRQPVRPFTDAEIALIASFADQAAIAVQNARLFATLQSRNREITEALRREEAGSAILRQISETPEALDETLLVITEAALRLTGLDTAGIYLLEGDDVVLRTNVHPLGPVEVVPAIARARLAGHFALVARTRTPYVYNVQDGLPAGADETYEEAMSALGYRSRALVPITRGTSVLGFLGVTNLSGERIAPDAVKLLRAFADQAAIAIENARLIRELRDSNREISENLDIQRVMGDVLSIVAGTPTDLEATLPAIANAARRLTDSDFATVHWIDGESLHMFNGVTVTTAPLEKPWLDTSFMAAVVIEGKVMESVGLVSELAERYPHTARLMHMGFSGAPEHSLLGMPMKGRSGALGALSVSRKRAAGFNDRHRAVLAALATQAVVAIENSKLFRQLSEKTEELEVASRHKSEFLANMSHELRTPLNAIIGYAELLQEECEDLGQQDFLPDLGKIHSAGKHLLTLISGILDLSKVEAGRMTMFLEDFDITSLIRDADAIVRPLVEKNGNSFVVECPDDVGVMHADLVKVRQVLFNLLSNAAKFTEGGTITLTVRKPVNDSVVIFTIRDTGIGMTDAQLARLFEAFSQASAETSRKYGGTGLGLALSREFCRMMGGDISVTSMAGEGSTFTVMLPRICTDTEKGA